MHNHRFLNRWLVSEQVDVFYFSDVISSREATVENGVQRSFRSDISSITFFIEEIALLHKVICIIELGRCTSCWNLPTENLSMETLTHGLILHLTSDLNLDLNLWPKSCLDP